jgi:DNA polymerase III delta prime subunit
MEKELNWSEFLSDDNVSRSTFASKKKIPRPVEQQLGEVVTNLGNKFILIPDVNLVNWSARKMIGSFPCYIKRDFFETVNHIFADWASNHKASNQQESNFATVDSGPLYNLVVLAGPPGTGKTTTAWYICCSLSKKIRDLPIYWENVMAPSFQRYFIVENVIKHVNKEERDNILEAADIIIFDGMTAAKWEEYYPTICDLTQQDKRVLVVSSLQLTAHRKVLTLLRGREQEFTSWSVDEYYAAMKNDVLFESVKELLDAIPAISVSQQFEEEEEMSLAQPEKKKSREEERDFILEKRKALIDAKYFFAGGSARWMFGFPTSKVMEVIQRAIRSVSSFSALFSNDIGDCSSSAVNQLCSRTVDGKCFIVSDYAVRQLFKEKIVERDFIVKAYHMIRGAADGRFNPALDGWILELDCIYCLKNSDLRDKMRFTINESSRALNPVFAPFPHSDMIYFHSTAQSAADLSSTLPGGDFFEQFHWFIPEIFNQGGFDFVQYFRPKIKDTVYLRFVQVTRSTTDQMKFEYMISFANTLNEIFKIRNINLKVTLVEIIMLIPEEIIDQAPLPKDWKVTGYPRVDPLEKYGCKITKKLAAWKRTTA